MSYFTIKELCVSTSHPSLVEIPKEGTTVYNNIQILIKNLLDPIRIKLGKSIIVTSGYRNEKLNKAVGGSSTSAHRYGLAADIHTGNNGSDNLKIVKALLESKISFDQCIIEYPTIDSKTGNIISTKWIHLGLSNSRNRKQILYTIDGKSYKTVKVNIIQDYTFTK